MLTATWMGIRKGTRLKQPAIRSGRLPIRFAPCSIDSSSQTRTAAQNEQGSPPRPGHSLA